MKPSVGVLALQGSYEAHRKALNNAGAEVIEVRTADELSRVSALCMPGGESTTMSMLLDISGLRAPLTERIKDGMPVLATCAGVILLANELVGDKGSVKVEPLKVLNATVDRNAYGRQVDSFEATLRVDWEKAYYQSDSDSFHGVFIRAPRFVKTDPDVVPLAFHNDDIVAVVSDKIIAATFHPELSDDPRFHLALINLI